MTNASSLNQRIPLRILSPLLVWIFFSSLLQAQDDRPHVVFLAGEAEYGAHWTLPKIADDLQRRFNIRSTVIHSWRSGAHDYDMPGEVEIPETEEIENLEVIRDADLLVMHIRFRLPPQEQYDLLQEYFDSGKPAIAFRTTSHGFWPADRKDWFVPFFGGHYKGHMPNTEGTTTIVPAEQLDHPILRGVPKVQSWNDIMGIYITAPLNETATTLMMGKTGLYGPAQPVTWINEYQPGQKIFYTSLGGLESFVDPGFINMVYNAVYWALDREIPEHGVLGIESLDAWEEEPPFERLGFGLITENPHERPEEELGLENRIILQGNFEEQTIPAPPKADIPEGATVLFDGTDLSKWRHWDLSADPVAMLPDARAVSPSPDFPEARWQIIDGALEARPGFGSLLTNETFGNYRLHVDFLIPPEPDYVPSKYKGSGGVFLDGRYEIKIMDSYGQAPSKTGNGSVFNQTAPRMNASKPLNTWQSMDIEYRQLEGQRPRVSVRLNGELIHDQVKVFGRSPFAIREDDDLFVSEKESYNLNQDQWSAAITFRTQGEGYLFSYAPKDAPWDEASQGFVIWDEQLIYRKGGDYQVIESESNLTDGEWHTIVLSAATGQIDIYLDGKMLSSVGNQIMDTPEDHVFRLGQGPKIFRLGASDLPDPFNGEIMDGEIRSMRMYQQPLSASEASSLAKGKEPSPKRLILNWSPESGEAKMKKGPIRLQSDLSKIRYANIWVEPLND